MNRLLIVCAGVAVLALQGCGGGGGSSPTNRSQAASFRATIDGNNLVTANAGAEYRQIAGSPVLMVWAVSETGYSSIACIVNLPPDTPVTVQFSGSSTRAPYAAYMQDGWGNPAIGASGSITITELDPTHCKGTFSFSGGGTSITSGRFDVPIESAPDALGYIPGWSMLKPPDVLNPPGPPTDAPF